MTKNEITEAIDGILFIKEKLYNGIYSDKLGCLDTAISVLKEKKKLLNGKPTIEGGNINVNAIDFLRGLPIEDNDMQTLCVIIGELIAYMASETSLRVAGSILSGDTSGLKDVIDAIVEADKQPIINSIYSAITKNSEDNNIEE